MSNDNNQLIRMANQIGQFFESMPDHAEGQRGWADHIAKFWEPRMRRAFLAYIDSHPSTTGGVSEFVLDAARVHRAMLQPAAR